MIKEISLEEIPEKASKAVAERKKDIDDFIESGALACEVMKNNMKARTLATSIRQTVKRMNAPVTVIIRDSRVFLLRTDIPAKQEARQ